MFIYAGVAGQNRYQQVSIDGGGGVSQAFAGAISPQINPAFYGGMSYYPIHDLNFTGLVQGGVLSGNTLPRAEDPKQFRNSYTALDAEANVYLGIFFNHDNGAFLNALKGFYAGAGFGYMSCRITNAQLKAVDITDHISNNLKFIPLRSGYEFDLLHNQYQEPLLKVILSSTLYYVADRGLDGYYDPTSSARGFFVSYTVGVKYTFAFRGNAGNRYNKLN